ncbi:MAG: chemotaxis protein CheB [Candidatus Dormibacteraeota bacterium]|nr:chemotaxis protein CheB [Candidatus Dormibacteraeota bacterium]
MRDLVHPTRRDIVTIGGSAGAIDVLQRIVAMLPRDLAAAVFVVVHVPATSESALPRILSRSGALPALHPNDGDPIELGRVFVAPPDRHLLLGRTRIHLSRGPREHTHRPASDPLFRSAARNYDRRVIGVVLSGMHGDGAVGLAQIVDRGGLGIVQDPEDAPFSGMPEAAIRVARPQHVVTVDEIAPLLVASVGVEVEPAVASRTGNGRRPVTSEDQQEQMSEVPGMQTMGDDIPGSPTGYSCPDCGGVLWERGEADRIELICRIGHLYTTESLIEAKNSALEGALWAAVRALEEQVSLHRRMADHHPAGSAMRARFAEQAAEDERQSRLLRDLVERRPEPVVV